MDKILDKKEIILEISVIAIVLIFWGGGWEVHLSDLPILSMKANSVLGLIILIMVSICLRISL